ncbi:Ribosomal protein [Phytophthora cinnamomi]|uniref:Ribosomal protein n=1 Tax=Phytophthora cinnamomi TaxID=4785 RepID=UPI00355A822B|nr:Ribosomal protein [Phytophthora cinnamomi]
MVLSVGVNESEGIFEDVDLSSPPKPKKSSGAVVAPATMVCVTLLLCCCVCSAETPPSVADLEKVVTSFGGEFNQEQAEKLVKEL